MADNRALSLAAKRQEHTKALKASVAKIVNKLSAMDVHRVSLFGSYASGKADLFTDLDILVIMDTDKPFVDRLRELYSLLALPVDADILCYTPQEFDRLKHKPFFQRILAEELVLYEKKPD